jgi:hypothetical protein
VWRPPAADRHHPRSRGHPGDPGSPRPLSVGAESRPRATRVHRRRALIALRRGGAAVSSNPVPHDGANQPPIRLAHLAHVALDGGGVPGYDAPDRRPRRSRVATQITLMAVGAGAEGRGLPSHVLGVDYPLVGLAIMSCKGGHRLWWVSFAPVSDASSGRATIVDQSSEGVIKPCQDISPSQGRS